MASPTSFDKCCQEAESWLQSSHPLCTGWRLLLADATDRQLVFNNDVSGLSFKILCHFKQNEAEKRTYFKVMCDQDLRQLKSKDTNANTLLECLESTIAMLQSTEQSDGSSSLDEEDEEDSDDIDLDYYGGTAEMEEVVSHQASRPMHDSSAGNEANSPVYPTSGSSMAVHRLQSDLRKFMLSDGKFGIRGSPRDDNLFLWDVQFIDFDPESQLAQDLCTYSKRYNRKPEVQLEVAFPQEYPMTPPFIRIIMPRFKFLTGHVTVGGSICMELLTKSGWRPTNDIESIMVQVRAAIISDSNAGLDMPYANKPYDQMEARMAFARMVERYKW